VGGLVAGLVADLQAEDGLSERARLAVDVEIARSGDLAASEQEDLLVAGDQSRHDRARLDDAAAGRSLPDLGRLQQLLERADARFLFALLILGRVVAAVLLEVALFACSFDAC